MTISVLIVDDEEYMRDSINSMIIDLQFKIDFADDGRLAINKLKTDHYDLLLLDWHLMSKLSGKDVLKFLLDNNYPNIGVIVLSGSPVSDMNYTLSDMFKRFSPDFSKMMKKPIALKKPIDETMLKKQIINLLDLQGV